MKTKNISARYVERAQQMVQNEESAKCRLQVHLGLCVFVSVSVPVFVFENTFACLSVAMFVSTNKHNLYFQPRWSSRRGRRCWRRGRRVSSTARCSSSPRWRRTRGRRRTGRECSACWWCGFLMVRATYRWPVLVLLIAGLSALWGAWNWMLEIHTCLDSSNCVSQSFQLPMTVNRWSCHSLSNWLNFQPSH